jgi:hypothetical protein
LTLAAGFLLGAMAGALLDALAVVLRAGRPLRPYPPLRVALIADCDAGVAQRMLAVSRGGTRVHLASPAVSLWAPSALGLRALGSIRPLRICAFMSRMIARALALLFGLSFLDLNRLRPSRIEERTSVNPSIWGWHLRRLASN